MSGSRPYRNPTPGKHRLPSADHGITLPQYEPWQLEEVRDRGPRWMRLEIGFNDRWPRANEAESLNVQRRKQVFPERLSHVVDMRRVSEVDG